MNISDFVKLTVETEPLEVALASLVVAVVGESEVDESVVALLHPVANDIVRAPVITSAVIFF